MKKILSVFLSLMFIVSLFPLHSLSKGALSESKTPFEAVQKYWNAVNDQDWDNWLLSLAPCERKNGEALVLSEQNHIDNAGILTVSAAKIINITVISNDNVPHFFYPELCEYFSDEEKYVCLSVDVKLSVKETNRYFTDGNNTFMMIAVCEEDSWFMATLSAMPEETFYKSGIQFDPAAPGSLSGFGTIPSCKALPSTINVRDNLYVIHHRVPFNSYLLNVIYNEISSVYNTQAIYANIVGIKTFTWCFYVKQPYAAYGYDICFGWVSYKSSISGAPSSSLNIINQCISDMSSNYMIGGPSSEEKLFYADFNDDPIPDDGGYHGGNLIQTQSNILANNGYTWKQILHYFYDNSGFGTIRFRTTHSHTYGSSYSSSATHHWKTCSSCSCVKANSYTQHTWVLVLVDYVCSVCGQPKMTQY